MCSLGMVLHALDDEGVMTIAGPAIIAIEGLENDQGKVEFSSPIGGSLEREVRTETALRDHPIKYVVTGPIDVSGVEVGNPYGRNERSGHADGIPSRFTEREADCA